MTRLPSARHAAVLALLLATTFPSCATVTTWSNMTGSATEWPGHKPTYPPLEPQGPVDPAGVLSALMMTPVTLAWDLVTMPIQIARGDPPYGSDES